MPPPTICPQKHFSDHVLPNFQVRTLEECLPSIGSSPAALQFTPILTQSIMLNAGSLASLGLPAQWYYSLASGRPTQLEKGQSWKTWMENSVSVSSFRDSAWSFSPVFRIILYPPSSGFLHCSRTTAGLVYTGDMRAWGELRATQ